MTKTSKRFSLTKIIAGVETTCIADQHALQVRIPNGMTGKQLQRWLIKHSDADHEILDEKGNILTKKHQVGEIDELRRQVEKEKGGRV